MFDKSTMLRQCCDVRRLLVVCLGNICRSPFAATYLREKLTGLVEVREGGYIPTEDRPTPGTGCQAAAALGIDLSKHRNRAFSDEDLDWVDMILCFDADNYDYLRKRLGGKGNKIWPLGTLLDEKSPWIADPYRTGLENFRKTYETIRNCCDELIARRENSIDSFGNYTASCQ